MSSYRTTNRAAPLRVKVLQDGNKDFSNLEKEWEDLWQNSARATPFQSWAWLYSWWENYGEGHELCLVEIREARGLLVGLMPLMRERRRGFERLLFVGTGITDQNDVLVREDWVESVAKVGERALRQIGSWHVADLQELRPEAVAWDIFWEWAGPRTRIPQSNCVVLYAKPWEELLAQVRGNVRRKSSQTVRRATADGVRREIADQDSVEQAIQRWLALHRESWQDKEVTPEHLTRRFGSHMLAAAKRMSKSGLAEIHEFRRGQEVIASDFALLGHGWIGAYLDGANGYARRRYRTSALFTWNLMNLALERGSPTVNLLRGEEEQKLRWNPLIVPNRRLILGRGRDPAFAAYSAWHLMRSRAIEYAKSGHAPDWMNLSGRQLRRFLPV